MASLPEHAPEEFEQMFVQRGRLACEAHFKARRPLIDAWLRQLGKQKLIAKRAAFVRQREAEFRASEKRAEMAKILAKAIPVEDPRLISDELAAAAAQHLRIGRNGGFRISPTGAGDWWVGLKRRSSADLLDMAVARGFDAVTLTGSDG